GHAVAAVRLCGRVESVTFEPGEGTGLLGKCVGQAARRGGGPPPPAARPPPPSPGAGGRCSWPRWGRRAGPRPAPAPGGGRGRGGQGRSPRRGGQRPGQRAQRFIDWLHARAVNLLSVEGHWRAVERVAAALLELRTLSGAAVRRAVLQARHG